MRLPKGAIGFRIRRGGRKSGGIAGPAHVSEWGGDILSRSVSGFSLVLLRRDGGGGGFFFLFSPRRA